MSAVWTYFKISDADHCKADCKLCGVKVSRGGAKPSSFGTSNLIKHLKSKHDAEYKEFYTASSSSTKQPTLEETLEKREKLSKSNPRWVQITEALALLIAYDDQPFSLVENWGFRNFVHTLEPRYDIPSRHFITTTELPRIENVVKEYIQNMLHGVLAFSFTTDIWSCSVTPMSLISLTAQWIGEDYTRKSAILHAKQFRGSHTGRAIADEFEGMLETWGIPKSSVHVVIRDSAANMMKAMHEAELPSLSCVAHTLQLAVGEGLLSQRSVSDAVAVGRKLVGHFKHSALAYSRLEDIQLELLQPTARLQQDVQTRWNSTYYMIQSLIEQKRALILYASQHELPTGATLSAHQWTLLEHTKTVLAPFEEMTKKMSKADAMASDVIPAVTVLLEFLTQAEREQDQGIKTMKATLTAAVTRRLSDTERNPLYSIATVLDPRYKDYFFSNANTAVEAKEMVRLELQKLSAEEADVVDAPTRKHRKTSATSSLDSLYDKIANERASQSAAPEGGAIEFEKYIGEGLADKHDDPLQYWGVNRKRFPTLAQMSRKYLSAPCSSVESERLFSAVSNIVDEARNRITAENTEMILFIKKNLPLTPLFKPESPSQKCV